MPPKKPEAPESGFHRAVTLGAENIRSRGYPVGNARLPHLRLGSLPARSSPSSAGRNRLRPRQRQERGGRPRQGQALEAWRLVHRGERRRQAPRIDARDRPGQLQHRSAAHAQEDQGLGCELPPRQRQLRVLGRSRRGQDARQRHGDARARQAGESDRRQEHGNAPGRPRLRLCRPSQRLRTQHLDRQQGRAPRADRPRARRQLRLPPGARDHAHIHRWTLRAKLRTKKRTTNKDVLAMQADIDSAIDNGVEWLLQAQNSDGSWSHAENNYRAASPPSAPTRS